MITFENLTTNLWAFRSHIDKAIDSYKENPADSDYQKGYLAALVAIRSELIETVDTKNTTPDLEVTDA